MLVCEVYSPSKLSAGGTTLNSHTRTQWSTQEFFSGGVQQIKLSTEDRENGDLGAVAP